MGYRILDSLADAVSPTRRARAALRRAAFLALTDPRQRPDPAGARPGGLAASLATPRALRTLAAAIDAARRDRPGEAAELLPRIDRARLLPGDRRLLDAARAMVSLGLGDRARAAQQALLALPTGGGEIDALLGRVVVTEAWRDPERLAAIHDAFRRAGLGDGLGTTLSRLGCLVRLRVAPESVEALATLEARALGDEARALGDDALATELDARARASTYR